MQTTEMKKRLLRIGAAGVGAAWTVLATGCGVVQAANDPSGYAMLPVAACPPLLITGYNDHPGYTLPPAATRGTK